MAFNVSEKDLPEFNKLVREDLFDVLNNVRLRATETVVEESRDPFVDAFNNIEQLPSEGADNIYDAVFNEVQQAPLVAVDAEKKPSYADSIRRKDIPPGGDPKDFIITDPKEILSTPLYEDKVRLLGLVDEDYKVTDFGAKFANLMEAGIFDENGVLTPKGRAYSLSDIELEDPANIKEFNILWEDGVIRESASPSEIVGGVGNLLKDAALGVVELAPVLAQNAYYQFDNRKGFGIPFFRPPNQDNRPQSLKDKTIAAAAGTADTWSKNFIELIGLADVGANLYMRSAGQLALDGLDPELDAETYRDLQLARQRQWSNRKFLNDMEAGEASEVIFSIEGAVAEAQEVKKRMGEEEFNKVYGRVGSTMQIVSPENAIPLGTAVNFAKGPALASRLSILAQKTVGNALELQQTTARASLALAESQNIIAKNALVQERANRIIARGGANAPRAKEILDFSNKAAREAQELIPDLTKAIEDSTKQAANLSSKIPVAAAEATLKLTQAGRNLRAMPAKAIGTTIEGFGNTLTKVDDAVAGFLKERGLDKAYSAAIGAAGVVGLAGNPVIGAVAGGAAILKAGKFISNYGKLFKYVGKEMTKVRGQIPFWKRVAAHTTPGTLNAGIAHTFNMLDLSGVTSDVLRRTGRGVAAAYPVDLMFEYLSDGGDMRPQTFLQAGAESLVIGGSFAAAGGAFMGTRKRMRELSIGDQLNLVQSMTDDRQKALYYTLPSGVRSAVATYGIANPTLNYVFKDSGASNYDPNTNTATINVKSNNPIRPLIAHETLHHTIIKNNMEGGISALFLGDTVNNTVGGLLRSRDGKLDPNFAAFRDRYYQRLNLAGMTDAEKNAIYPLEKVAVEYFIEQHSDQYAEMAESGELGAIAASGSTKRKLSGVLDTVLPRIPVLRDLHLKSGGMIDKDGGWVTGNGILDAEGVRTNPIANKMFRDMNRRSSGRSPGQFDPLVSDKQDSGAQITLDPTNPIDSELLHPLVKVDENGVPILENGKPVALDKSTLLERALAGLTAREVMTRKKAENYIPEKGEAHIDDFNEYIPGWLSNDVLAEMFAKNRFNPEQKRIIREVNRMIREGRGGRAVMINFPATTRNKSGKVVYKPQAATLRDTVPVAITISKDGNLLFGLMSVTKLQENIQKRSKDRRGKKLYGGNVDLILRDTVAMMQFHKDGVDSIEYFKEKYGAVEADERKKFINTMFGLLNQKEQAVLNPMILEDGVKSKDNVYRTYRADRVSKAVAMNPDEYPAMPFSYEAVSAVRMPEQTRQMPEMPQTAANIIALAKELDPAAFQAEMQEVKKYIQRRKDDGVPLGPVLEGDQVTLAAQKVLTKYTDDPRAMAMLEGYGEDQFSNLRYMPEKRVATGQNQAQEPPLNERQPSTIQAEPSRTSTGRSETTGEGLRGQGRLSGSSQQLQSQGRPGDQSVSLIGLPATVKVPGIGEYTFGPNEVARNVAAEYARSVGIDYNPPRTYAKVDKARATRIADEYDKMVHAPNDPRVRESYDAMIKETLDQWEAIKKTGLIVEPIPAGAEDPYAASPRLAIIDVKENNHLWFFPTNSGFGGTESAGIDISGNPLMNPTGEILNGHTMLANDVFRIVHDYFGHIKEGVGFRADGEENAWRSHSAMYSDKARPAMTAETRGQNSWVNYGPFAEFNKTASGADTQYAPQKTGLLPDWVAREGAGDVRYMPEKRQEIGKDMVVDRGDENTLDVTQAVDKKGEPVWKNDKPVLVSIGYNLATAPNLSKFAGNVENPSTEFLDNIPYNLNGAERGRVEALIKNGVVDRLANDMAEKTNIVLKDPAIAAGKGWYSRMRVKLLNALGESGRELFSQFLGATSAQTPVDENFLQTVDAYEGMMAGRYNRHRKGYLTAIRAENKGTLNKEIVKSRAVEKTEEFISKLKSAIPSAKKAERIPIYAEIKSLTELINKPVEERTSAQRLRLYIVGNDLLPRRSNGAKFNANSGAVLKVIAGVWLDNRESPKTPNFAGNLSGRTIQATIDIWAARYIRRMIYGGEGKPWRIQPKSEVGVSNEDFAFSQIIMQRAAEKLKMNPDDLQAILWFAEKDVWDKNKWTKNEGAKKSSFDDIFDVFFPEGRRPLTFAEGFAVMKANKDKEKSIAKEKKESIMRAEADSLGVSIAALAKMKKKEKSK